MTRTIVKILKYTMRSTNSMKPLYKSYLNAQLDAASYNHDQNTEVEIPSIERKWMKKCNAGSYKAKLWKWGDAEKWRIVRVKV